MVEMLNKVNKGLLFVIWFYTFFIVFNMSSSPWPYRYSSDFLDSDIQYANDFLTETETTPARFNALHPRKVDFGDSNTNNGQQPNTVGHISLGSSTRLSTFSGDGNVNYFLEEFESYCLLAKLTGKQKLAAFHLQLRGPARIWFLHLPITDKTSFETFLPIFKSKYGDTTTVQITDEVLFNQFMPLKPNQTIDQYHSSIVERAANLHKSEHELMSKLIAGLPSQLAFFVRAGNPNTLEEACNSAKMGEAYGYRNTAPKPVFSPQYPQPIPPPQFDSRFPPPASTFNAFPTTQPVPRNDDYQHQKKQIQDLQFQVNSLQHQLLQTHINKSPIILGSSL